MSILTQLENEFQFTYPQVYKQLHDDQMLDWLRGWNEPWTKERNWSTEIYPQLKAYPPLLLHGTDFELLPLPEIAECLRNKPDYWDQQHQFIPFGISGAGDWYAFYYNMKDGDNLPIAFVWHDMDEVNLLAANLNDFIFRQLLELTQYVTEADVAQEAEYKNKLHLQLNSHKKYLSAEKVTLLEHIYERKINTSTRYSAGSGEPYNEYGILTSEEITVLLQEQIGFPLLNHTFPYQVQL